MQFKSIITVLSIALAATAIPLAVEDANLGKRTGSCNSNQSAVLCSTNGSPVSGGVLALLLELKLLNILNCVLDNQQSANACCSNSNIQNGVVNLNAQCVPLNVGV